jgi:hypothetical protein
MNAKQQELDLKMKQKRRCLNSTQTIELLDWLLKNKEEIVSNRMSSVDAAGKATEDLEFEVSPSSVRSLGKHKTVNIKFTKGGKVDSDSQLEHRVSELEKTVTILTEMISDLKRR